MENSSHYSSFSTQQQRFPQDVESQYFRSDPDEIEDGMPPELTDAYPINATSDRLFTNVPIDDPDEYIEQEHNPIWQVRGSHVLSFNEQHERNRRIAAQLRDSGSPNLRTVQLFNGNLVLDCPVAPRLLREIPHAQSPERDEFSHMRYSSVTCDPSDFRERNYTLRPLLFAKPRRTELLVAVTMYNEDAVLLGRTIKAVMSNLKHLCSQKSSTVWGKEAWKKVVICIISDGRSRINRSCLALLTGLGVYQDGIAIQRFQDLDVVAHLYEVVLTLECMTKLILPLVYNTSSHRDSERPSQAHTKRRSPLPDTILSEGKKSKEGELPSMAVPGVRRHSQPQYLYYA